MAGHPRKVIEADGHIFEGVPWQEVTFYKQGDDEYYWEIANEEFPRVPNPYWDGVQQSKSRKSFDNSICAITPKRKEAIDVAIDYISILLAQEIHEALEWTRVDGKPLAETHPESHGGDDGYWKELQDDFVEVIKRYIKKYPKAVDAEADA